MDPGPFTLRDLESMARGEEIARFDLICALMAEIRNSAPFSEKTETVYPQDLHPHYEAAASPVASPAVKMGVGILRDAFVSAPRRGPE